MTGKVVTFYSPRSEFDLGMTLANLAWHLAENGNKVLAVDWRLDSPSLYDQFSQYVDPRKYQDSPGVSELIRDFPGIERTNPTPSQRRQYGQMLQNTVIPLQGLPFSGAGSIELILAESLSADPGANQPINWVRFYEEHNGDVFISSLRDEMVRGRDFVLVNCPSWSPDNPRAGANVPPELVLVCFTDARSSVAGAVRAVQSLKVRAKNDRHIRKYEPKPIPVVFRVDGSDESRLHETRRALGQAFRDVLELTAEGAANFRPAVEIPDHESSLDGILAVGPRRSVHHDELLAAYRRLADVVAGDSPDAENEDSTDLLVCFASADRMWAEWIASEARAGERRIALLAIDQDISDDRLGARLDQAERALVVVSANLMRAPLGEHLSILASRKPRSVFGLVELTRPDGFPAHINIVALPTQEAAASEEIRRALGTAMEPANPTQRWLPRFPLGKEPMTNTAGAHNDEFTGRVWMLDQIRDRFLSTGWGAAPQVLAGPPGVGKTSLALEYMHRFGNDYDVVWWIPAETDTLANGALFELASKLDIHGGDQAPVTRLLNRFQDEANEKRWLLVFDSADRPDDIANLLPRGLGHVLITSAHENLDELKETTGADVVMVDVFDTHEATEYLKQHLSLDPQDALRLAGQLGNFPLAVHQARLFLAESGTDVKTYLERVAEKLGGRTGNEARAVALWQVALDAVRAVRPAAAKAFEVLTFLAPEPVPFNVCFGQFLIDQLAEVDPNLQLEYAQPVLTNVLTRYGLITVDSLNRSVRILRLVQDGMREQQAPEEAVENRRLAFGAVAAANPRNPDDPDSWPRYRALWPHVESPGFLTAGIDEAHRLTLDLIRYRYKLGDFLGSERLADRAQRTWADVLGRSALHTLLAATHQARALRRMGTIPHLNEARQLDEDAFYELTETKGAGDLNTLAAESGLAADLRALGREYDKALQLDRNTVEKAQPQIGRDNPRTLEFISNLATSLRMVGRAKDAAGLDKEVFALRLRVLGENHPYTWFSANNYGRDLRDLGKFEDSKAWLERAYAAYQRIHGPDHPDHPDTLWVAKNLAVTLRRIPDFDQAHKLSIDTMKRSNRELGSDHVESLVCLMTVATTYSGLGDHDVARRAAADVVAGMTRVLGAEHVYTLMARNNLAVIELKSRPPIVRVEEMEEIKEKLGSTFGENHWILLIAKMTLANHHAQGGDPVKAMLHEETVVTALTELFGADHPDAICAAINLAISQRDCGAEDASRATMAKARKLLEGLPADNIRVRFAMDWRRWTYTYIDPPPLA